MINRADLRRMPGNLVERLDSLQRQVETLKRAIQTTPDAAGLSGIVEKSFFVTGIADNVATDVFRINTTAESVANSDGGTYAVFVHALVTHAGGPTVSNNAVKSFVSHFCRAIKNDGSIGVNSAVSEINESASAATTPATRDISTVTMTVVENNEHQCDVQFQIDLTGTGVGTASVHAFVRVVWQGFLTAPQVVQM